MIRATVSVPWAVLNRLLRPVELAALANDCDVRYGVNHQYVDLLTGVVDVIRQVDKDSVNVLDDEQATG